uniref:Uncharacterized protein n=1 Tax=Mycolicibacterium phage phi1_186018 TaxID=3236641 RepID=A0AB39AL20_9CAUD
MKRVLASTTFGAASWSALAWAIGLTFNWTGFVIGILLSLVLLIWLEHRRDVRLARLLAEQPAILDPAHEVTPGVTLVALVAAYGPRPWWAPWRPCHSDHVTLAETTLDRPLVGNVRVGLASDRFVILDDLGTLLEYHGWRENFRPGSTVTAVVRTR